MNSITFSEVCESCCASRMEAAHKALLDYTNAIIYVRKLTSDDKFPSLSTSQNSVNNGSPDSNQDKDDPEFIQVCKSGTSITVYFCSKP